MVRDGAEEAPPHHEVSCGRTDRAGGQHQSLSVPRRSCSPALPAAAQGKLTPIRIPATPAAKMIRRLCAAVLDSFCGCSSKVEQRFPNWRRGFDSLHPLRFKLFLPACRARCSLFGCLCGLASKPHMASARTWIPPLKLRKRQRIFQRHCGLQGRYAAGRRASRFQCGPTQGNRIVRCDPDTPRVA